MGEGGTEAGRNVRWDGRACSRRGGGRRNTVLIPGRAIRGRGRRRRVRGAGRLLALPVTLRMTGRHAPGLPTPHPAQSVTASRTARPHGPYGPRWRGCATLAAPGSGRVWRRPSGPHQTQPDRFAQDAPVWTPRPGGCPARGRMWLRKASPPPALSSPSRALAAPHPGRIWSSKADDLLLHFK